MSNFCCLPGRAGGTLIFGLAPAAANFTALEFQGSTSCGHAAAKTVHHQGRTPEPAGILGWCFVDLARYGHVHVAALDPRRNVIGNQTTESSGVKQFWWRAAVSEPPHA
jgi:hypothetical protein